MKSEREMYEGLRSALAAHDKPSFSTIRAAIENTRNQTAVKTTTNPPAFSPRLVRRLAYAVVCLLILAGAGLLFLPDFSSPPQNEIALFEAETGNISGEIAAYGSADDGLEHAVTGTPSEESAGAAAPDTERENKAAGDWEASPKASASYNLSEALETLLQKYADQPDHTFAVIVLPPDEGAMNGTQQDMDGSAQIRQITAAEIYALAARDYFLDVAPSSSAAP